jgi:signal transduction histidine kinase
MNHLVNDMSELSRMQSGTYELHLENMDMAEKIREILDLDEPLIENAHLHVHLDDTGFFDPVCR